MALAGFQLIHVVLFLVIVLVMFGGKKIPELAKGLGEGMKEFKNATREHTEGKDGEQKS